MTTGERFSAAELEVLAGHGIVLFADRVIFAAQPPMPAARMAEVERQCQGPLPPGLRELWSTTAGGSLDYDLAVELPAEEPPSSGADAGSRPRGGTSCR